MPLWSHFLCNTKYRVLILYGCAIGWRKQHEDKFWVSKVLSFRVSTSNLCLREIKWKQPNVGSNTDNIAFHWSVAVSGGLALLRSFSQWKIEHQWSRATVFFILFFCNRFHTDGLNLSRQDAQYYRVVTVLITVHLELRVDICISARFKVKFEVMPLRSFANF